MLTALYIRAIRGNWPLIVALAICGGFGLGLLAHGKDPVYASEARLLVTFEPAPDRPSSLTSRLMQRRVKTYTGLLAAPRLTRPVIETLGLDTTPARLGERVEASSPLNTHEIRVTVTDSSPAGAAAIATALAAELGELAQSEKPTADLPFSTRITVADTPTTPGKPVPVRWPLHALAGALAGIAIGLGLAVLRGRKKDSAQPGVPVGR